MKKRKTDTKNGKVRRKTKNQNHGKYRTTGHQTGHHYTNAEQ